MKEYYDWDDGCYEKVTHNNKPELTDRQLQDAVEERETAKIDIPGTFDTKEDAIEALENEVQRTYSIKTTVFQNGEKVSEEINTHREPCVRIPIEMADKILALLKGQDKKEIKLHKKHVLTLNRNDEFTMRKLYESVCETLLDEGEMIIARTDDREKVEFVFYVTEGR